MELIEKYEEGIHDLESFFLVKKTACPCLRTSCIIFFLLVEKTMI